MSKKQKSSMIGHDPLAWINPPTAETSDKAAEAEPAVETPVASAQAVEDKETETMDAEQPVAEKNAAEQVETEQAEAEKNEAEENEAVPATIAEVLDAVVGEPVSGLVTLEGDLTIQTVQALHDLLSQSLEHTGDIQLDAEAVGRVDTAAMQTLYAFAKKARDGDRDFSWLHGSDSIKEVATTLGMAEVLKV